MRYTQSCARPLLSWLDIMRNCELARSEAPNLISQQQDTTAPSQPRPSAPAQPRPAPAASLLGDIARGYLSIVNWRPWKVTVNSQPTFQASGAVSTPDAAVPDTASPASSSRRVPPAAALFISSLSTASSSALLATTAQRARRAPRRSGAAAGGARPLEASAECAVRALARKASILLPPCSLGGLCGTGARRGDEVLKTNANKLWRLSRSRFPVINILISHPSFVVIIRVGHWRAYNGTSRTYRKKKKRRERLSRARDSSGSLAGPVDSPAAPAARVARVPLRTDAVGGRCL